MGRCSVPLRARSSGARISDGGSSVTRCRARGGRADRSTSSGRPDQRGTGGRGRRSVDDQGRDLERPGVFHLDAAARDIARPGGLRREIATGADGQAGGREPAVVVGQDHLAGIRLLRVGTVEGDHDRVGDIDRRPRLAVLIDDPTAGGRGRPRDDRELPIADLVDHRVAGEVALRVAGVDDGLPVGAGQLESALVVGVAARVEVAADLGDGHDRAGNRRPVGFPGPHDAADGPHGRSARGSEKSCSMSCPALTSR